MQLCWRDSSAMHDSSRPSDGKWCASITTSSRFAKRCCEAATPGTAMSRLGLLLVTSAAILAVALASLVSAQEPKEDPAAAVPRPFLVGCPDNLGGGPWEDEGERHQGHWFFKVDLVDAQPRKIKGRTLDVTYSRLHDGNGTRCDPVVGPFVASKWAGLGRGMIALAPRGSAGDTHTINLSALTPGVEYYIVDTFQDAWQRYRAYRSIMLE